MKYLLAIFKKIKKLRKRYKVVLLALFIIVSFFVFSQGRKTESLQFATVKKENIQEEIAGAGILAGETSVNLHFRTSGKLAFINVDIGEEILKGQAIAELDTIDLNINLREAENTLRDKRAIVDKIKDDQKDVTTESYTQRQARTTAEVAQDNAYEAYLAARKALADSVLYSPIHGVVVQVLDVLQNITASDIIAQIVDSSESYFDTEIDEADIGRVKVGLPAEITLDAYTDAAYKGTVAQIVPQTKHTSSGATVITVRIKLDTSPANFVNGLGGEAVIIVKSAKNVLTIPLEALREDNTVVVQSQRGLISQKVTPGISSDTKVGITKGLKEKEKVLLNPPAVGISLGQNRSPLSGILGILRAVDLSTNEIRRE